MATRALVRTVLSSHAETAPAEWRFVEGERGKPYIADPETGAPPLHFNLTNTRGLVVCAVRRAYAARRGCRVDRATRGDGERRRRVFSRRELEALHSLPPSKQRERFFSYWTLKESYIKARGMGLALPLDQFSFLLEPGPEIGVTFDEQLADSPERWRFNLFSASPRHMVAVGVDTGGAPLHLRAVNYVPAARPRPVRDGRLVRLWAISDLHVGYEENRIAVETLPEHPDDWLILAGDLGETLEQLEFVFRTLRPRFRRLVWVPGNHELWTLPPGSKLVGQAKYEALVALCREYRVLTPEDPYELFDDGVRTHLIAPTFTLYDYSYCPAGMTPDQARAWALEAGLECADEHVLHAAPFGSREEWCAARCALTEARLAQALEVHDGPTVLINHFPLKIELARLPLIPRFSISCGTRRTHDRHLRFRASVVVSGHLHIRRSQMLDGVRFEEVSLGYPRQWRRTPTSRAELRQILPAPLH